VKKVDVGSISCGSSFSPSAVPFIRLSVFSCEISLAVAFPGGASFMSAALPPVWFSFTLVLIR
jgi:hypothetical protein